MNDIEISRSIGDRTQEYLDAFKLLKGLLDEESERRVLDYIAGMGEARTVVLTLISERREHEAN